MVKQNEIIYQENGPIKFNLNRMNIIGRVIGRSSTSAQPNAEEVKGIIGKLVTSLTSASLLEDRRVAIKGIKSLVRQYHFV